MGNASIHFYEPQPDKQGENGDQTGFNPTQLYVFLENLAVGWKDHDRLDVVLLRAICRLSIEQPAKAAEGFTSLEVAEAVGKVRGRAWSSADDKDQMSDDVRRQWNKLTASWVSRIEGISQIVADARLSRLPHLAKSEGGGAGRSSRYRVEWLPAADAAKLPDPADTAPSGRGESIRYVCEDIQEANLVARLFTKGYELHGWRRFIFVTVVCGPVFLCWLMLSLVLIGFTGLAASDLTGALALLLSASIVTWVVWTTTGPLLQLPTYRILMAPWWMQSYDDDRLIELRIRPGASQRTIKAVLYAGTCPICGGKVTAKSGGLAFWGRIVGRCENAPVEHVYSFDHVTRVGAGLRQR